MSKTPYVDRVYVNGKGIKKYQGPLAVGVGYKVLEVGSDWYLLRYKKKGLYVNKSCVDTSLIVREDLRDD